MEYRDGEDWEQHVPFPDDQTDGPSFETMGEPAITDETDDSEDIGYSSKYGVVLQGGGDVIYGNGITQNNDYLDSEGSDAEGLDSSAAVVGNRIEIFREVDGSSIVTDGNGNISVTGPRGEGVTRVYSFDAEGNVVASETDQPVRMEQDEQGNWRRTDPGESDR